MTMTESTVESVEPDPPSPSPTVASVEDILQARIGRLTVRVLADLEWQMVHAPPAARRELLKSVIPALFRGQSERSTEDELADLRVEVEQMNVHLRTQLYPSTLPVLDIVDAVEIPDIPDTPDL